MTDRNTSTVCRSAIQSHISDIGPTVPIASSAMFRTASSVKLSASPASGLAADHRYYPCAARLAGRTISGVSRHYPDIHAGDICGQTKGLLPILDVSRNGTFSRLRGQSTRAQEL